MTIDLAQDYIRGRMAELGFSDQYYLRLRHFVLRGNQQVIIDGDNHLFILVNPKMMLSVQSDFGIYDLTLDTINELQYEHHGKIIVKNYSAQLQHAQFIQVIPKN